MSHDPADLRAIDLLLAYPKLIRLLYRMHWRQDRITFNILAHLKDPQYYRAALHRYVSSWITFEFETSNIARTNMIMFCLAAVHHKDATHNEREAYLELRRDFNLQAVKIASTIEVPCARATDELSRDVALEVQYQKEHGLENAKE